MTHQNADDSHQHLKNSIAKLCAYWVCRDTILWNIQDHPGNSYALVYSPDAALALHHEHLHGGIEIPLRFEARGADAASRLKFPHLASFAALKLPAESLDRVPEALKGQTAVMIREAGGRVVSITGLQIPGVLDDLYTYSGALGVTFSGNTPSLRLWAPTARSVNLELFTDASTPVAVRLPMQFDPKSGVWSLTGNAAWLNKFYLFEVEVYVPSTGQIENNLVTDPYSLSLSTNSRRSQIVNLKSTTLKPKGWDKLVKPAALEPENTVIYELHIRDFSISDESVPADLRGTYRAFTLGDSNGMKHIKALAEAGLTHIHLLPAFDIASVNEDKTTWQTLDRASLAAFPPDSDQQMLAVQAIKGRDGFNWGYDPYHFNTPEGSYATDPNGAGRIKEFREMVQGLNQNGLRVVMDMVYNHTMASGLEEKSVLDKAVPGYYHRLDAEGHVEQSTCCSNTASEHAMMLKLMIDSLLLWAVQYRVDGFRFDLMGHHMLADMQAIRKALSSLTLEKDGVDGQAIYLYGEGWNFGEVANNARGVNAVQHNIGGTGIGVFNDRLRDAVRGGSPFGHILEQGYATGLYFQPNVAERRNSEQQKWVLFEQTDLIRITLAGNLQDYELVRANGDKVRARDMWYNGSMAGYTHSPRENVVYVAAHDNETLWDIIQLKSSHEMTISDRVRLNNLALSLVAFSQGVPFFHAGDDLLRSKSLDRNSYNSGDWFNKIDWTYETNNWGVGLPGEGRERWDIFRPLLANPALKVGKAEISFSAAVFREYLHIRKSSALFRLQTASEVRRGVTFLNTGPWQIPGLIVMQLADNAGLDSQNQAIVVLFNANPHAVYFSDAAFANLKFELHPVQAASVDEVLHSASFNPSSGAFTVPGRTSAVFVLPRSSL